MTNEPATFEEFIAELRAAGWRDVSDAQHENIRTVYDEWMQRLHNAEAATEYWRLMAERPLSGHRSGKQQHQQTHWVTFMKPGTGNKRGEASD